MDCWNWLWAPVSGATEHHLAGWAAWHGRLMVLSWGFLIPIGGLIARYLKVLPNQDWPRKLDNKWWWHAHLVLQTAGLFAACLAVALAWGNMGSGRVLADVHAWFGWSLLAVAAAQALSGVLRGSKGGPADGSIPFGRRMELGDHYLMTRRRLVFERLHKFLGWLLIAGAVVVIVLGLFVADAPRWMFIALLLWWSVYGATLVYWQYQGRCIDTYQAIWGPDPSLPGNRRAPVGPGVRRFSKCEWAAQMRHRPLWGFSGAKLKGRKHV
ncbi:hypothetical protein GCM10027278_40600 [Paralcaligenes ginsengisoli]